jgi:hypothetical protein
LAVNVIFSAGIVDSEVYKTPDKYHHEKLYPVLVVIALSRSESTSL